MKNIQENSNYALFYNSIVLYLRLIITSICGVFTTRFALQALGVVDFGLYSVVGSIITFIAIINTMMLSTSNRFIASAIGKGDINDINETFNVNLIIHISVAILVILVAIPLGNYFVYSFINYEGNINNAISVFNISIISSIISFIGVPYNGLLLAKERFFVFCSLDIVSALLKLITCYCLLYFFHNKLIAYAVLMAVLTVYPTIFYIFYCKKKFRNLVSFKLVKDKNRYKDVLNFSIWVGYGALAQVGQVQCAALLVNIFFNTIMNTALGVANYVKSIILMFAQNITKPISPQITKSFALGNKERCYQLMILSSKMAFMMTLLISCPFLIETNYILEIWLNEIPPYAVLFIRLIVVNIIIDSLNMGIAEYVFAGGKIKSYQLVINTLLLFSILTAYILLLLGFPAYSLLYVYILFTIIVLIARQLILHKLYRFDNTILIKGAYIPSLAIFLFFILISLCLKDVMYPLYNIIITECILCVLVFFVGLNKNERNYIIKKFIK